MNIDETLIAKIVKAVIDTLAAQGMLNLPDGNAVPRYGCGVPRPHLQSPASRQPEGAVITRSGNGRRCIVTEELVHEYLNKNVRHLAIPADALITPLAADTAKEKGLQLVRQGKA